MENDYSNLEHLVQDVTSLDTARMTLRWALERLSVLDHTTRDLEKQLRESRDRHASAERRSRELEDQVAAKMKLLTEREAFYRKLEETVSELSEGKIDLAAIAEKEAELEKQQAGLEKAYQRKAEELERSHQQMVAQWTERLRQAETYEPRKLSETLQKYDEYRRHLEETYQARMLALEQSFHQRESMLLQRETDLENISSEKLQQARRMADAQKAWEWERERLLEERRGLDERLQEALAKIEQLEGGVASAEQKYWEASRVWNADRERLAREKLEEISRIEAESGRILEERTRLIAAENAGRIEHLREDHQGHLAQIEQEWVEKIQSLDSHWESERKRLLGELSRQEALLQEERDVIQELRDAMVRQKNDLDERSSRAVESLEKAHQELLEREKSRWMEEMERKEGMLGDVREKLQAARRELADSSKEAEKDLGELRRELTEDFESRWKVRESEESSRRDALIGTWQSERERLVQDVSIRDQQIKKAQAEIVELNRAFEEFKSGAEKDLQTKLADYYAENDQRIQALQQVWGEEKKALLKQLERRGEVIQALRDHLRGLEERQVEFSAKEQELLAAERTKLTEEFQKALSVREKEEISRREALEKTWGSERQRFQGEWSAALEDLKRKDETIAKLNQALAEKASLVQTRDELMAQFESMKTDLQDQHQKRVLAFESAVLEKQKTQEARWQAEKSRLVQDIEVRDKKLDEAQASIERLHEEMEWQKATERARTREVLLKEQEKKIVALEQVSEAEKLALNRQIGLRDSAISELTEKLKQTDARLTQAGVQAQVSLEGLRTQLTSEFQQALQQREVEDASRRKVLEDNWQLERAKLILGFEDSLKAREMEEAGRRKASEESAYAERIRLLEDISRRNDEFKRAQIEIRGLREAMERQKVEMEAAFAREKEGLEATYKEALEQRMLRFRKEMQEREAPLLKLKEQLRLAENKLIESTVQSQETLEALRTKLTSEFEQALKGRASEESARARVLEEGWKRERLRLEQQLAERQQVVEELGERTRKAQDEVAASASRTAAQMENLRAQLMQEFENKVHIREEEWTSKWRILEETWKAEVRTLQDGAQAERGRLAAALAEAETKITDMQHDFEERVRVLRTGWVREKEDLAAKLEEDYDQKMNGLLAACEEYRKELEATERALRQREEDHEQGKR